jgi:hypothetical protein
MCEVIDRDSAIMSRGRRIRSSAATGYTTARHSAPFVNLILPSVSWSADLHVPVLSQSFVDQIGKHPNREPKAADHQ